MSRPSKTIEPDVGSISLMIVRPSVVLPQPDSPTTPSVSPLRTERSTPSTARTAPTVCLKTPALIGKCLTSPSTRSSASSDAITGESSGAGLWSHPRPVSAPPRRCSSSPPPTQPRRRRRAPRPAPPRSGSASTCGALSPIWRSSGMSVRHGSRPRENVQRGWKAQPGGGAIMLGGCPGIGCSHSCSASRRAMLFIRPTVYGCRGSLKIVKTSASSTTRPAYMTTTRSASSAIRPRSCVIRTIAAWVSWRAALSTSTIWAWIVTSSAVVGSSAIRTLGLFAIAIAIIARWRMPPENSCGYWSIRRSANGTPTSSSSSIARFSAASSLMPSLWTSSASTIWLPTVSTGFSDVIGSWKIIAMSPPRISRSSFVRHLQQVLALVDRLTLRDPALRRETEDREHRDALARAGLADDPEHLARHQVVADVGDRLDDSVLGLELDCQIANRENRVRHELSAASGRARRAGRRR